MGSYCDIESHFPETAFSADERSLLFRLRQALPANDEWYKLPYEERERRRFDVHRQLAMPGSAEDWKYLRQFERDDCWYVSTLSPLPPHLCPPFPSILVESNRLSN